MIVFAAAEVKVVRSCSLQLTGSPVCKPSWPCMLLTSVCLRKGARTFQGELWGQGHPADTPPEKLCLLSCLLAPDIAQLSLHQIA